MSDIRSAIEYKSFTFKVTETKEITEDNIPYGIIKGYASTYGNVDRGGDVVMKGAFTKTLDQYRKNNRPVKMCYQHNSLDIIGGFAPHEMLDDDKGLFVAGKINLFVQRGKEAYALAKQGVLTDMSIGYSVDDYDIQGKTRRLKDLQLWEISMVGEPMNPQAQILDVKSNEQKKFNEKNVKEFNQNLELLKTLDDLSLMSKDYLESLLKRKVEEILIGTGNFSKAAAVYLAGRHSEWSDSKRADVSDSVDKDSQKVKSSEINDLLKDIKSLLGKN